MRLTLDLTEATLEAGDTGARRVSGTLVPYGRPGRTSVGEVTVRAGAIRLPEHTARVRLLRGHDREAPIGVLSELDDTADALRGTFTVARTPAGDAYLAELDPDAPIRDGLSVELDDVTITAGEVTAGTLVAVAAVPLPAYPEARAALAAEDTPTESETAMPELDETTLEAEASTPAPSLEPARPLTTNRAPARTRPVSALHDVTTRLIAARLDGSQAFRAALADITPSGNGGGNESAGLMTQALGELWDGMTYRPRYTPHVASASLTGTKLEGFRWNPEPEVDDYAGNKAAIPSNAAKLEYVAAMAERIAGGHDLDRIYRDLGDPAVLASYWSKMAESIAKKLDERALAVILAAAGTPVANADAGLEVARILGTVAVSSEGAATYCLAATNVIVEAAQTPSSDSPAGLPVNGMSLPPVYVAPELDDNIIIVGIRQAARQATFSPPVRVEAVNVANAGIDAALYSYSAEIIENSAAVVAYDVTPAAPPARASRASS